MQYIPSIDWEIRGLKFSFVLLENNDAMPIEVYEGSRTSDKRGFLIAINFNAKSLSLFSSNELVCNTFPRDLGLT